MNTFTILKTPSTTEVPTFTPQTWRCIHRMAAQLAGRGGFTVADREDLAQELALRVWKALRRFDPSRGNQQAFIVAILKKIGTSLLRQSRCRKRGRHLQHRSIFCDEDFLTAQGLVEEAPRKRFELRHDVAVILDRLPMKLRLLAEQLQKNSVAMIARRRGISRARVYEEIEALRTYFDPCGEKIF